MWKIFIKTSVSFVPFSDVRSDFNARSAKKWNQFSQRMLRVALSMFAAVLKSARMSGLCGVFSGNLGSWVRAVTLACAEKNQGV